MKKGLSERTIKCERCDKIIHDPCKNLYIYLGGESTEHLCPKCFQFNVDRDRKNLVKEGA
jgi:hypothetical protein